MAARQQAWLVLSAGRALTVRGTLTIPPTQVRSCSSEFGSWRADPMQQALQSACEYQLFSMQHDGGEDAMLGWRVGAPIHPQILNHPALCVHAESPYWVDAGLVLDRHNWVSRLGGWVVGWLSGDVAGQFAVSGTDLLERSSRSWRCCRGRVLLEPANNDPPPSSCAQL